MPNKSYAFANSVDEPILNTPTNTQWHAKALTQLTDLIQKLSSAPTPEKMTEMVCAAARALVGADGATFVMRDGNECHYVDENAIAPLWKGYHFPINSCVSGWAMLNAQPVTIEDIYTDHRIPEDLYRPTFVKSLVMVPVRRQAPMGAIGVYWSQQHKPLPDEVMIMQALADSASLTFRNMELYAKLKRA